MKKTRKLFDRKALNFIMKIMLIVSIGIIIISNNKIANAQNRDLVIMSKENRVALVIGNGSYKSSPLANTIYDAVDMAEELENCGFSVIKGLDCSRKEMRKVIGEFGEKVKKSLEFDYPRPKGRGITPNSWLPPPRFQKQIF